MDHVPTGGTHVRQGKGIEKRVKREADIEKTGCWAGDQKEK